MPEPLAQKPQLECPRGPYDSCRWDSHIRAGGREKSVRTGVPLHNSIEPADARDYCTDYASTGDGLLSRPNAPRSALTNQPELPPFRFATRVWRKEFACACPCSACPSNVTFPAH